MKRNNFINILQNNNILTSPCWGYTTNRHFIENVIENSQKLKIVTEF